MSAGESYTAVLVLLLLQIPFFLVTLVQIILMIFREGAVVVLAGQLQLAAAGGFTAVCAMPNTDPVTDTAGITRAIVERARAEDR